MTQIKKVMEAALKEAAFKHFQTDFRNRLNNEAEQAVATELATYNIMAVSGKNLHELTPEKAAGILAKCITVVLDKLFHDACIQAKIAAYNASYGQFGKRVLYHMSNAVLAPLRDAAVDEYISRNGSFNTVLLTAQKVFEQFYAKNLFAELVNAEATQGNKAFLPLLDGLSAKAVKAALLSMLELAEQETYPPFIKSIAPAYLRKLMALYAEDKAQAALNNVNKEVLAAFFSRRG